MSFSMRRTVVGLGCCSLASAAHGDARPCDVEPGKSQPWCDVSLTLEDRVADLVSRVPIELWPGLMTSPDGINSIDELNIPEYQWQNEALHGVADSPGVTFGGSTPYASSFPQVITTSMSFNISLFRAVGSAISTEARAFSNEGHAGLTFWTPNINIYRDPRWGRGQETAGEDPMLSAEYAVHFVRGMQEGADPAHLKTSACLKHFTAYDLEFWNDVDRHHFDAQVTLRDLAESFNVPFEAGVREGKASCIMCSYNSVNGVPSCANRGLLTGLAREEWGFDGYITSDCGAVDDVDVAHNYTATGGPTINAVLDAGMDFDCGAYYRDGQFFSYFTDNLGDALADGSTDKETVEAALKRLFRIRMRLGHFDPAESQPYLNYGVGDIDTAAHRELALDAARQGITLLKNNGDALPLDPANIKKLAVVGPGSNRTDILQGSYFGTAPYLVSLARGLAKYAEVEQADGCLIECRSKAFFEQAVAAAQSADAVVVVVGNDQSIEKESQDRTDINLPGLQREFAQEVAAAATGPVILVVMAGGSVDIAFARDSDAFDAVLFVGYPGQEGGNALAETVFGENNPGGRLTQTFYPANFVDAWKDPDVGFFEMGMRPNASSGNPGRGYRFYTGEPVYKFGDGISYTSFAYHVPKAVECPQAMCSFIVQVRNEGQRMGRHSVLVYAEPPSSADSPKSFRTFARVELDSGKAQSVTFGLRPYDFTVIDAEGKGSVVPGEWTIHIGDHKILATVSQNDVSIV